MRAHGFTMLELLVTVAVATILITIAIPSFMHMLAANQRQTIVAELISSLTYARSEAIARNVKIEICPGTDTNDCAAGNWDQGWIVVAKPDPDTILQQHSALPPEFDLNSSEFADGIVYLPSGRAVNSGHFALCAGSELQGRKITVSFTGRPHVTDYSGCSGGN